MDSDILVDTSPGTFPDDEGWGEEEENVTYLEDESAENNKTYAEVTELTLKCVKSFVDCETPAEELMNIRMFVDSLLYDHNSGTNSSWKERYVDFTFFNVRYSKKNKFSGPKCGAFVCAMNDAFLHSVATYFSNAEQSFEVFKQGILDYSAKAEHERDCFTVQETSELTKFVSMSFFRNFLALRLVFASAPRDPFVKKNRS
eukprot:g3029.t1